MRTRDVWRVLWGLYRSPKALVDAFTKAGAIARSRGLRALARATIRKLENPTLPILHLLGDPRPRVDHGVSHATPHPAAFAACLHTTVTVVIPTKGTQALLDECLTSLAATLPSAARLDIIVVNNGRDVTLPRAYPFRIRVNVERRPFNWSAYNNAAAAQSNAEFLLLLNDDVTSVRSGWLDHMIEACAAPTVGPVAPILVYPDGAVQHAGIALGADGLPFHRDKLMPVEDFVARYGGAPFEVFAVTGACMLVSRSLFTHLGGLDTRFALSYNDVDFCRRAAAIHRRAMVVPAAQLVHGETRTRPLTLDPREQALYRRLYPAKVGGPWT